MLQEMQHAIRDSILDGSPETPVAGVITGQVSSGAQLDIHRINTFASLVGVLQAAYSVICRLVGEEHFNHAAHQYIRAHPPRQPQLSRYGWRFARFLSGFSPAQGLLYLSDLARLEWARNEAYFAADAVPLDPSDLQLGDGTEIGEVRFGLHPSAALIASPHAIHQIWRAARPERDEIAKFDPNAGAEHVLIVRTGFRVDGYTISRGDFTLLLAVNAGATFQQAANAALAIEPELDLQQALLAHFTRGTFGAASNNNRQENTR